MKKFITSFLIIFFILNLSLLNIVYATYTSGTIAPFEEDAIYDKPDSKIAPFEEEAIYDKPDSKIAPFEEDAILDKPSINLDITSKDFTDQFKNGETSATVDEIASPINNTIVTLVNHILGILQVIGGLILVVSIALYGFKAIVSASGEVGEDIGVSFFSSNVNGMTLVRNMMRVSLIGAIFLFSSATFVRFIFNIFWNL